MKKQLLILTAIFAVVLNSCKKEDASPIAVSASSVDEVYTETGLPVQKAITYNVDPNIGGYLEALPAHYSIHPGMYYSLILFFHGQGQMGDGSQSSLPSVASNSVPHLLATGQFPANVVWKNGSKNENKQFIILSPQFKSWPVNSDVDAMLNYAKKKYRVDSTRIYLVGLSMGGGELWDYLFSSGQKVTAAVDMAGASWPTTQKGQVIAKDSVGVWAFHNNDDPTVPSWYSVDYVQYINSYNPFCPAKLTLWPTGGHDCWTKASDPTYRENGLNIYEWLLTYRKKKH